MAYDNRGPRIIVARARSSLSSPFRSIIDRAIGRPTLQRPPGDDYSKRHDARRSFETGKGEARRHARSECSFFIVAPLAVLPASNQARRIKTAAASTNEGQLLLLFIAPI